eukprot:TRINITY_DN90648_c0_g1_i1.p1 TRINITY_DN90648_c0_g1~~TRINITY_DN90648_c0_g1_i1.p1  ORF type:complete len:696 (+),score=211.27 TRINITY_DN90648_c0_g1_i1:61-2148(+)
MAPSASRRLRHIARHVCEAGSSSPSALSPAPVAGGFVSDAKSFLFGKVEETASHPGDAISEVLVAHGVKFVFCLSGGHISPILVGAEKAGVKVVDVRHEVNAVFAADAVARLTGVPGVAAVTAGPGVTNTITAIKNATMAQSPLVLIGGAAPMAMQGRGALQDIDQRVLLEPIVKKCWTIKAVRDIVPSLREAFCEAASGVPGPVYVEMALDLLFPYLFLASETGLYEKVKRSEFNEKDKARVVVPYEAKGSSADEYLASLKPDGLVFLRPKSGSGPSGVTKMALQATFRAVHADARVPVDVSPLPVSIPTSPQKDIDATAAMLKAARKPVFVLGSQSTLRPDKLSELAKSLEMLGAPVFLGGMARGLFGRNNPCFVRQNRGKALKNADLVVLVGTVVDFRMGYGKSLPPPSKAKVVAVSRDDDHLELNRTLYAKLAGGGWTAALTSRGDPCDFVLRLVQAAKGSAGKFGDWAASLKADEEQTEAANEQKAKEAAFGRGESEKEQLLNPLALLRTFEDAIPDNATLIGDGGDFVATAAYIVRPRGPLQWMDPGVFGTLGVGAGFALGAKLARPDQEVWLLWGDGAAGYSIVEFDTFVRHKVPVLALVGNDACWSQIERDQVPWFGSPISCELAYSKYDVVAEAFGGRGMSIGGPGADDVAGTIRSAQKIAAEECRPVLINALIGKTNFREGSISA